MKKSIRIHIGGYFFNIDEEAYKILEIWLKKVQLILTGKESYKEIIEDIESGIAEHFRDTAPDETVCLSIEDVEKTIKIMGYPEDFDDNEEKTAAKEAEEHFAEGFDDTKRHRRLYRNPDERLLGGVCSGLGNYFNIDPVIFRLIFIVALIFWGSGTLIYIILWIVTPEAKTAAQKLEMKGQRVNISNIEKNVRQEFQAVRKGFSRWTKTDQYSNLTTGLESILFALVKIIKIALRVVVIALGALMIFLGITVFLTFVVGLFAGDFLPVNHNGNNISFTIRDIFEILPMNLSYFTVALALLLTIGIPFFMIAYSGFRIVFNVKRKFRIFEFSALGLWIIGIGTSLYIVFQTLTHYKQNYADTKSYVLDSTASDTVYVKLAKNYDPDFDFSDIDFNAFNVNKSVGAWKLYGRPKLTIERSFDKNISVKFRYKSSGRTREMAAEKCKAINYNWTQKDSLLSFFPYFIIPSKEKFYNQKVETVIMLPVGKAVHLGELTEKIIWDIPNIENEWDGDMVGKTWIMTENGLTQAGTKVKKNSKHQTDSEEDDDD